MVGKGRYPESGRDGGFHLLGRQVHSPLYQLGVPVGAPKWEHLIVSKFGSLLF